MLRNGFKAACGVALAAGLALGASLAPANAQTVQSVEQFYKGRQIDLIIYTANNSAYDFYARLLAAHMGRFLPGNPTFIPKNMVGAGGLKAFSLILRPPPPILHVFPSLPSPMALRQAVCTVRRCGLTGPQLCERVHAAGMALTGQRS